MICKNDISFFSVNMILVRKSKRKISSPYLPASKKNKKQKAKNKNKNKNKKQKKKEKKKNKHWK